MPISLGTSQPADALKSGAAKLWVLLVGVNHYQDERLRSLQYPAPDCQGLARALRSATQAFPSKEFYIHHDFAEQLPTLAAVRKQLIYLATAAQPQDTILFYFSGHGMLTAESKQAVLCLQDTDKTELAVTGLPLGELLTTLGQSLARQQLVWLDACHSGGLTLRGAKGEGDQKDSELVNPTPHLVDVLRQRAAQGKGFYALLSCDQEQRSWEFPELGHGVFTYYLMKGLRGEAADSQGIIDADGLYKYVYHQTLRYIDKANQQIRLVNRQKQGRGEIEFQSEYPLQTPKRIVEGMGDLILGMQTAELTTGSQRRALIFEGLSHYPTSLALGKLLQQVGQFALQYWPQPDQSWETVKASIQDVLTPQSEVSDTVQTVLIYLRGHIEQSPEGESWLVLGDGLRLYRSWLRQQLRRARGVQQIVILDCPGAVNLQEWVDDLSLTEDWGQCVIAAAPLSAQSDQFAQSLLDTLQSADAQLGLPVAAWIAQLQVHLAGTPLAQASQEILPLSWLSGTKGVIEMLPSQLGRQAGPRSQSLDLGLCPYLGLRAFAPEQSQYFYGRQGLTEQLIAHVRHNSALAVVGASGSGKSSVMQAGLMAQLFQGQRIPGSDQWWIRLFQPGAEPLKALAARLVDPGSERERGYQALQLEGLLHLGSDGFVRWLRERPEPMVVLVIDQFEEIFTLAPEAERQAFLALLHGAMTHAADRFKLVLGVRADFVAACLAEPTLVNLLQTGSVFVPPQLTTEQYREIVLQPAEQVGLQVESGLVDLLLREMDSSTGELPLLEFVLEKLWEKRQAGRLTIAAYQDLGGMQGALERQAQAVYESLTPEAQNCARWIFLSLTQLGAGTEDTRRRLLKTALVVKKYPVELVESTLEVLTAAKLIVVRASAYEEPETVVAQSRTGQDAETDSDAAHAESAELSPDIQGASPTVEIAHEILIRHWSTLRWWLDENRSHLQVQRQLAQQAADWQASDRSQDFVLTGSRLSEAESLYIKYTDELPEMVQQFVEAGFAVRQQHQRLAKRRLRRAQLAAVVMGGLGLLALGLGGLALRQSAIAQAEEIEALNASTTALLSSHQPLDSLKSGVQSAYRLDQFDVLKQWLVGGDRLKVLQWQTAMVLHQSLDQSHLLNRFNGHTQKIEDLVLSGDGQQFWSTGDDGTVRVWRQDGALVHTIDLNRDREVPVGIVSLSLSLDETRLAVGLNDKTVELWQVSDLSQPQRLQSWEVGPIPRVALNPAGNLLAVATRGSIDASTVGLTLWQTDGTLYQRFKGHLGGVGDVVFSPNGQGLASAGDDGTVRFWQLDGTSLQTFKGHQDAVASVAFNVEGTALASGGDDGTVRLWPLDSARPATQLGEPLSPAAANRVHDVAFSPDGLTIAAARANGQVQLWSADGSLNKTLVGHQAEVTRVQFRADGQEVVSASGDQTLALWQVAPPMVRLGEGSVNGVQLAGLDGPQLFAVGGWDGATIWEYLNGGMSSLRQRLDMPGGAVVEALSISEDGQLLATALSDGELGHQLQLWKISDGTLLATLPGHDARITSLAFSADGQYLASGSDDRTVKLWSLEAEPRLLKTLQAHTDGVTDVSFHPTKPWLVSSSYDRTVRLWQLDIQGNNVQGTVFQVLDLFQAAVATVTFSPDGNALAAGSWDSQAYVWQLRGQSVAHSKVLQGPVGGVPDVTFTADSHTLIAGSGQGGLYLWEVATGRLIQGGLNTHGMIHSVSVQGPLLVVGTAGGAVVRDLTLATVMANSCDRIRNYLLTNARLSDKDRHLCD
ncbi:nSTAND1 domain-containing NTPase [Leptothoe kymatousa]|uniref:Caspase family protein n=1 Tax=Leptothoe kymatousa TAU-MAC 1615 TaxID=2364775 RepID=A0ABS5XZ82_9CYAN|nr:caspase family protein [Leptothoe kymatousa]MBT9310896.1 caspase family protein [Leptothoe kymatousa TAU-MAC 1615]